MNKTVSLLRGLDLLGYNHGIVFKGDRKVKTCFGGILTIIIGILFTMGFIYFGRELVSNDNPILISSEKVVPDSSLSLKKLGFHFAPANTDGSLFLDNPEFMRSIQINVVSLSFDSENGEAVTRVAPMMVEYCKEEFFEPEVWAERNKVLNLSKWLCVNPNKVFDGTTFVEGESTIANDWSTIGSKALWMNIRLCDTAKDPGCDQWMKENKDFFLVSGMTSYYFDAIDYENPVKYRSRVTNTLVGSELSFIDYLPITVKTASLDYGAVTQLVENKTFHSVGTKEMALQTFDPSNPNIYDFFVHCPRTQVVYSRRYTKLQEVIADLGGMVKLLMIVFGGLSKTVGEYSFFRGFNTSITTARRNSADRIIKFRNSRTMVEEENRLDPSNKPKSPPKISFWLFFKSKISKSHAKNKGFDQNELTKFFDIDFFVKKFTQLEAFAKSHYGT